MPEEKKDGIRRREFLINSAKILTSASLPLALTPKACHQKEESGVRSDCRPARTTDPAPTHFDVIVIGSGFGATVAVSRLLARNKNLNILVLERGLWWLSPDRPKPAYLASHDQEKIQYFTRPDHNQGVRYLISTLKTNRFNFPSSAEPLYRFHIFDDIDILTASGVGGGSLIYLNVTIPPISDGSGEFPILKDWPHRLVRSDYDRAVRWMTDWRGNLNKIVTEFPLRDARLNPDDLKEKDYLYLSKARALRHASTVTGNWRQLSPWTPAPLSINEYDESNPDVVRNGELEVCTRQGRCFLGCPTGAIQTLDKTLLNKLLNDPVKYPHLSLESLRDVSHIQQARDGSYNVWFRDRGAARGQELRAYNAAQVILAAGTLGSTQILLRSECEGGLELSERLGYNFSGNGDLGGFIVNVGQEYPRGTEDGRKINYRVYPTRGPMITSYVQYEADGIQMTVEDGGIPPTLALFTRLLLNLVDTPGSKLELLDVFKSLLDLSDSGILPRSAALLSKRPNPKDPKNFQTEQEMLENVFYFQCMGRDEPGGRFQLNRKGEIDLKFDESPINNPIYKKLKEIMKEMANKMGGRFVEFPSMLLRKPKLFTLHPLGGCPMGKDVSTGVVDSMGRVFKRAAAGGDTKAVYKNLYVMDASIFPGPVAVNPTLTIVALALKIAEGIEV